jgi:predicted AlkP superfamily pyrophosphatase or phosphodiesterase
MIPSRFPAIPALVIPITLGLSADPGRAAYRPPPPALVVVVVVDQMRADYLQRWPDGWQGGFRAILRDGAVFPHGLQDHALTETAPGHSTILSGRDPAHTGIVVNQLGVPDPQYPVLDRPGATGASPSRFVGTTLLDWMRRADSATRFLSVSAKDRSAILTVGRSRGPVFWWNDGEFTTSRYYADVLPSWVKEWNARRGAERLAGTEWNLLRSPSSYPEKDSLPFEHGGSDYLFPHPIPADPSAAAKAITHFPWMDSLTLDIALEGARALGLGRRSRPDLLVVGLSATDYIGHAYGPDSREIHDQMLRLDHWLGWFLDSLAATVPRDRILVALTADHGVTGYPELARLEGRPGGHIQLASLVRTVNAEIGRLTGDSTILQVGPGLIYGDTARLRSLHVSPESLATNLAPRVWKLPGVVNAWTPATLGGANPKDVHAVRWWRSLAAKFSWLVCAVASPGYVWGEGVADAEHGTTNPDDVDVPIVFMGPGIRPGIYSDTVRTTDIAPTLARLLDVRTEGKLDGRRIKRALK